MQFLTKDILKVFRAGVRMLSSVKGQTVTILDFVSHSVFGATAVVE